MRPLEIALILSNAIAFVALAIPRIRKIRYLQYSGAAAVCVAAAQILAEGGRWQVVPAYVLSGLLAVTLLISYHYRTTPKSASRRLPLRIAQAAGYSIAGLALILSIALPAIMPVFRFPAPTGPYGIGTVRYHWEDKSRPEIFTDSPADHRELMVQIWYPAAKHLSGARDPYVHDINFATTATTLGHLPPFTLDHLKYVVTNAYQSVPVAGQRAHFPVILFSPGRGGYPSNNNYQIEELVSHGYVVVGIDHPYTDADVVFPDGRHIALDRRIVDPKFDIQDDPFTLAVDTVLGEDAVFVLDRVTELNRSDPRHILTDRLDLKHVGILGSSLGGITVAEACRMDVRFRACLGLDVAIPLDVVQSGLQQPTMWIVRGGTSDRRDEGFSPQSVQDENTSVRSTFSRLPGDGYLVSIPNMFHSDISDFSQLMTEPFAGWLGLTGPGDWRQTHKAINGYSLAFFDKELQGKPAPLLDGSSKYYSNARLEKR